LIALVLFHFRGKFIHPPRSWHVVVGGNYNKPLFPNGWTPQGKSFFNLFLYFFPMVWFTMVLMAKTSKAMQQSGGNGSRQPVIFGEMLQFFGIRLLMYTARMVCQQVLELHK
jgi:hypothetical protein